MNNSETPLILYTNFQTTPYDSFEFLTLMFNICYAQNSAVLQTSNKNNTIWLIFAAK